MYDRTGRIKMVKQPDGQFESLCNLAENSQDNIEDSKTIDNTSSFQFPSFEKIWPLIDLTPFTAEEMCVSPPTKRRAFQCYNVLSKALGNKKH